MSQKDSQVARGKLMAGGLWSSLIDDDDTAVSTTEIASPDPKKKRVWWRTWMGEQIPVMLNLLLMVWWMGGMSAATPWRTMVDIWCSAMVNLLGWKAMSIASRQQELNRDVGITDHRLECWKAAERTGILIQVLGLFRGVAFAATPPHLVHALFIATYRLYRAWYVKRRAARKAAAMVAKEETSHAE